MDSIRLMINPLLASLAMTFFEIKTLQIQSYGHQGEEFGQFLVYHFSRQVIRLAGQRNKQIRLEKINKEIAGYQFEE